jgi:septum site-determining protein MinC
MEIKGIKEGILITLEGENWQDAKLSLIDKIKEKQDFFQGARLVLDVGHAVLGTHAIEEMQEILLEQEINLFGVLSKSMVTQEAAQKLGLIYTLDTYITQPERILQPLDTVVSGESAVWIQRTMRSGFKVAYQGHVVVLGDVNPGAEIVASGSVIVWGRLRGTVHAGAEGDQSAVVCALDLSPTQLRIATKIATTPQDHADPKPEVASILDGQIVAEPWKY